MLRAQNQCKGNTMNNKTIIITGADGFLGTATVKKFFEQGANVVAAFGGTRPTDVDSNVHSIENCDLTNIDHAKAIIDTTCCKFSAPDILINIAGGFIWKTIKDTSVDDFDAQFNINFKTMYNMTKASLEKIENSKNGRIINIAAMAALKAQEGMAAYAVSKAAVMRFTEALAIETPDNVTVNAIMPSIIDTPVNRNDMPDADFSKWVTTTEIIDQMVFLASNEASGINGALIPVAGRV